MADPEREIFCACPDSPNFPSLSAPFLALPVSAKASASSYNFPSSNSFPTTLTVLVIFCPSLFVQSLYIQDVYHRQSRAPLRLQGALPDPPPFHLRSPIHACPFPAGKCQELFAEPFLYGIPIIFNYRQSQLVCRLVYGFK